MSENLLVYQVRGESSTVIGHMS